QWRARPTTKAKHLATDPRPAPRHAGAGGRGGRESNGKTETEDCHEPNHFCRRYSRTNADKTERSSRDFSREFTRKGANRTGKQNRGWPRSKTISPLISTDRQINGR